MIKQKKFNTHNSSNAEVLNEINTTPLVDVMLVLLIIFLITIPVVNSSINVSLPKEINKPRNVNTENLVLTISSNGEFILGNSKFKINNGSGFKDYVREIAILTPQPEIHLKVDKELLFEDLGYILKLLESNGIKRIAFLTEPK
ncbi:MAG: hypothetical protein CBD16_06040 [Betaproteobacteria bacterium TMED156]|nr:MAG: hypothetical protein CBD16_06040 [Betaproteobacteria bacterium TMED156]